MLGSKQTEWPALIQAGIRGLGLRPVEFWALTPAELMMMLGKPAVAVPLVRAQFDELLRAFPDKNDEA